MAPPPPLAAAPPLLLLTVLVCLPTSAEALTSDTTGVLTIVAIVLGGSAALAGIAVIGWYCWRHGKKEKKAVQPKPTPTKPPAPTPAQNQPMMLVAQSPMPGMQGFMMPTGGMMMGFPAGMTPTPGTALYQVPVAGTPAPQPPADSTAVEDLEANNTDK